MKITRFLKNLIQILVFPIRNIEELIDPMKTDIKITIKILICTPVSSPVYLKMVVFEIAHMFSAIKTRRIIVNYFFLQYWEDPYTSFNLSDKFGVFSSNYGK